MRPKAYGQRSIRTLMLTATVSTDSTEISRPQKGKASRLSKADVSQAEILSGFSPEAQQRILHYLDILSPTASYIGNDFEMKIILNPPGKGWEIDRGRKECRIDAADLVNLPLDWVRRRLCHLACRQRISRPDSPKGGRIERSAKSVLQHAIEDARTDNFAAENFPVYRNLVPERRHQDLEEDLMRLAEHKAGFVPMHIQAALEFLRQHQRDADGQSPEFRSSTPPQIEEAVSRALEGAKRAWWLYPGKDPADQSEARIRQYAKASEAQVTEHVWPHIRDLLDDDVKRAELSVLLERLIRDKERGERLPRQLKSLLDNRLSRELLGRVLSLLKTRSKDGGMDTQRSAAAESVSPEDRKSRNPGKNPSKGALKAAKRLARAGIKDEDLDASNLDPSKLSPELQEALRKYIDSLPDSEKKNLRRKAEEALASMCKEIIDELQDEPERANTAEKVMELLEETPEESAAKFYADFRPPEHWDVAGEKEIRKTTARIREEQASTNWGKVVQEHYELINQLENELREIFNERRKEVFRTGRRRGQRVNTREWIKERGRRLPPALSHAFETREPALECDYAVTVVIDISESMMGEKIKNAFAALVCISEAMHRLGIKFEVRAFNSNLYTWKTFEQDLDEETIEVMNDMSRQTGGYTNTGLALVHAHQSLLASGRRRKILIVISDGCPCPTGEGAALKYELKAVVDGIEKMKRSLLIGLGIGPYTEFIEEYFRYGKGCIPVMEFPPVLCGFLIEGIRNDIAA